MATMEEIAATEPGMNIASGAVPDPMLQQASMTPGQTVMAETMQNLPSPGFGRAALLTSYRTSSTISRGGYNPAKSGMGQWFRHPIKSTFRYSGMDQFANVTDYAHWNKLFSRKKPSAAKAAIPHLGTTYNPFQGAEMINRMGNRIASHPNWKITKAMTNSGLLAAEEFGGKTYAHPLVSGSTIGRISGANKMLTRFGTSTLDAKQTAHVMNYISHASPELMANMERMGLKTPTGRGAAQLSLAAMPGSASQYLGGYLSGASRKGIDEAAHSAIRHTAGKEMFVKGSATAARHGAEIAAAGGAKAFAKAGFEQGAKVGIKNLGKIGARTGAMAMMDGPLLPFMDMAAAAWMAWDLAKMAIPGVKAIDHAVNQFVKDGVRSFEGNIRKDPFGAGFVDTEAMATSRQRGVMAIQNSRLNARSILGNEAGMMYQHFN